MEKPNHPNCPYCGTNERVQKSGLNGTGSVRMRCENCKHYFTPNPKPMGHDPKLKEMAIRLYLEGMSFRGVGRVLGVNFQSVINWVNQAHEQLPHQVEDQTPADNVEIDELFTFVGKKRSKPTS